MSRSGLPIAIIGNEFIVAGPSVQQAASAAVAPQPALPPSPAPMPVLDSVDFEFQKSNKDVHQFGFKLVLAWLHRYSIGVLAILFLITASLAINVAGRHEAAQISLDTSKPSLVAQRNPTQPKQGPNLAVLTPQTEQKLQQLSSQPVNLTIGPKQVAVPAETVRSWIKVVPNKQQGVTYMHVESAVIAKSLEDIATSHFNAPSDQVTITRPDGSSRVVVAGRNGSKVGDTKPIANHIATNLVAGKGFQFNLSVEPVAFATLTQSNFDKLIEVDLTTKQMYAYEKGQQVNSWAISGGAPATPTPLGQYKIFSKLAIQDMRGDNVDGSRYFQPNVRWINYFKSGGYAIHGNYWRPASVFGSVNSSHGCVSLPDNQAKWVYDWAPVGTTIITHL